MRNFWSSRLRPCKTHYRIGSLGLMKISLLLREKFCGQCLFYFRSRVHLGLSMELVQERAERSRGPRVVTNILYAHGELKFKSVHKWIATIIIS